MPHTATPVTPAQTPWYWDISRANAGTANFLPVLTRIVNETAKRIDSDIAMTASDFSLDCNYLGAGYAVPGDLEFDAIRDLARYEGILLGPVYTARAMGALLDMIRKNVFKKDQSVLFWHTGGTPELFAWTGDFKK